MNAACGSAGVKFIAENGWAYCTRGGFKCSDPSLLRRKPTEDEISLYESKNHMSDFLLSARKGTEPVCPVEVGHRSNTICVLHHTSMKLGGRAIQWDPINEHVVADKEAEAIIEVPLRMPSALPV